MKASFSKNTAFEYLGYRHFSLMFMLAIGLHGLALWGWSIAPVLRIIDIPVRAIDIRLGDGDAVQIQDMEEEAAFLPVDNSAQVEAAMEKLVREAVKPTPKKTPPPKPQVKKNAEPAVKPVISDKAVDSPRQFVRFSAAENSPKGEGSLVGNSSDVKAKIKASYEQTISLWILKFKRYPETARMQGMRGKTVIRIRIDRRGNIRYSSLEGNTGYEELDRAALDMVRRANPVPAVPEGYPDGEMFEFLIPVSFEIK